MIRQPRPRPLDTVMRDEQILDLMRTEGAMRSNYIADQLRIDRPTVYLSLRRMTLAGLVYRVSGTQLWKAKT